MMRWMLLALWGCGGQVATLPEEPTSNCAEELSWQHTGQAFMLNYCTGCHSSGLAAHERFGAPAGTDFDTLAGVQSVTERIYQRTVVSMDMPPGGGPSAEELKSLEAWLQCGAPGEENSLPATDSFPSGLSGAQVSARVTNKGANRFQVIRQVEGHSNGWPDGTYMIEDYELSGDDAWFHGFWVSGIGWAEATEMQWDPPLHIQGENVSANQQVTVVVADGQETEDLQEWSWSAETVVAGGLEQDPRPTEIRLVGPMGDTHIWHTSSEWGITSRELWHQDGRSWSFLQQSSGLAVSSSNLFPLEEWSTWIERLVVDQGGM